MSFLVEIPLDAYCEDAFARFSPRAAFSIETARALMWMAQLAYEVRDARQKVTPVLHRWNLQRQALISKERLDGFPFTSTHGIVARGHGATFVAFAGTDPLALANWLTNFHLGPRSRDMHHGFRRAIDAVWPELAIALADIDRKTPLYFTGHSLGGALAVTAAARALRDMDVMASGVYTFGAPRVGAAAFAEAYNASGLGERTFRLIHGLDIIPTVPPSRFGFRHAGRMIACPRGACFTAGLAVSAVDSDDPLFANTLRNGYRQRWQDLLTGNFPVSARKGWLGWYQRYILPPTIADHLPERYRRAFETADQPAE
ncbi:MAG: lipase family protein [Pseudorhodoplanes sp.]|nr:lipase family protein [Pseudorhodoplanes sp.]